MKTRLEQITVTVALLSGWANKTSTELPILLNITLGMRTLATDW